MTATDTGADQSAAGTEANEKLQLDVQVDEKSACERHVVVTIPAAEVERYRKKVFDEIVPKAELPGFRQGKAPRKLVESRFRDQADERVKSELVMDSLEQITEGGYFTAISEPDFDFEAIDLPDEGDFKYEFEIEVRPDFEVPQWEGLKLTRPVVELTDELIDARLQRSLARLLEGEAIEGPVQLDDLVTLNVSFSHEGKELGAVFEESVRVRPKLLFRDAEVPDFDQHIVGKKEGDVFTIPVKISDAAADEALRGQEVEAEFEIVEIRRIAVEDLSEQQLEDLGFDAPEELREFVRGELQKQVEYVQQSRLREQIVEQLTAGADWELPPALVSRQTNRELRRTALELQRAGLGEDLIRTYLNAQRVNAREKTVAALRAHFVLEKIGEALNIEPSPEDYAEEIALLAERSDTSPRAIRARLEKTGEMDALRNEIIERKVVEAVVGAAEVTDVVDEGLLSAGSDSDSIDFAIAGQAADIPDAKHDDVAPQRPGAPKLPEKEEASE